MRRSGRLGRICLPAVSLFAGLSAVSAADGDLQRTLLEHGCIKPHIETVLKRDSFIVYRANCLGSSHKVLDVTCAGSRCTVSGSAIEDDQEPLDRR